MGIWTKGIIGVASAAIISTGAIAAFAANGTQPAPQPTTSVDVKGPCDEAEHANDPRCDGAEAPEDRVGAHDRKDDHGGLNEAEHGDDKGGLDQRTDDGANHDANDDHGGESGNSGPGSSSSGSRSSGGDD